MGVILIKHGKTVAPTYLVNKIPIAKTQGKRTQRKNTAMTLAPLGLVQGLPSNSKMGLAVPQLYTKQHSLGCTSSTAYRHDLLRRLQVALSNDLHDTFEYISVEMFKRLRIVNRVLRKRAMSPEHSAVKYHTKSSTEPHKKIETNLTGQIARCP